jgi:hypothetical protein
MGMIFKVTNIWLCKAKKTSLKIMIITRFEVLLRETQNLIRTLNKCEQKLQSWKIPLKYFHECF